MLYSGSDRLGTLAREKRYSKTQEVSLLRRGAREGHAGLRIDLSPDDIAKRRERMWSAKLEFIADGFGSRLSRRRERPNSRIRVSSTCTRQRLNRY